MKIPTKMTILKLILFLLYAICLANSLPITSTPLENNPDQLAWDALLTGDTHYASDHEEVRKIPKSIFITPNFNDSQTNCRSGYKLGADGKCHKTNNFHLDPLDILKTQIASLFSSGPSANKPVDESVDYDEDYDYDSYDSDGNSNGPYHVPLSVSFDDTSSTHKPAGDENWQYFQKGNGNAAGNGGSHKAHDHQEAEIVVIVSPTTTNHTGANADSTKISDKYMETSTEAIRTVVSTTSQLDEKSEITTPVEAIADREPLVQALAMIQAPASSATEQVDDDDFVITKTTTGEPAPLDSDENSKVIQQELEEKKRFEIELQNESFIQGDIAMSSLNPDEESAVPSSGITTDLSLEDITTMPTISDNTKAIAEIMSTPRIIVSSAVESTTNAINEAPTQILNINHDSDQNKRMRETVIKHELNEDAMDTIDQHNRFVYNHLIQSQHQAETTKPEITTERTTTTTKIQAPQRSLLDQLRLYNRFTEENRKNQQRINFPGFLPDNGGAAESPLNIYSNYKGGTIKFPGPVVSPLLQHSIPTYNRLIPDLLPKKPPEHAAGGHHSLNEQKSIATVAAQPFSWLPSGWTFDQQLTKQNTNPPVTQSNPRPVLHFWNKMPLIRDPAFPFVASGSTTTAHTGATDRARENSKSPTESLFKDTPASEIYKVFSAKNFKFNNR